MLPATNPFDSPSTLPLPAVPASPVTLVPRKRIQLSQERSFALSDWLIANQATLAGKSIHEVLSQAKVALGFDLTENNVRSIIEARRLPLCLKPTRASKASPGELANAFDILTVARHIRILYTRTGLQCPDDINEILVGIGIH